MSGSAISILYLVFLAVLFIILIVMTVTLVVSKKKKDGKTYKDFDDETDEYDDDEVHDFDEYEEERSYFRESGGAILKQILVGLHRAKDDYSETSEAVTRVVDYIKENYREPLHNRNLAKIAGYHEYYLNRIFVRQIGMSMHKYILNLRIKEGERLLLNTEMSISEVSAETGFNSATHFSTYFKKENDMSPLEYRQKFKNNI